MTSEQLKYLILLKNYPSFNAAAEVLHISFQAYAKAIRRLEAELGLQLVVCSRQGTQLTENGNRLINAASIFFSEIASMQDDINIDLNDYSKKRIVIPTDIVNIIPLKSWLIKVREKYPLLELDNTNYSSILEKLNCDNYPFAIISQICIDGYFFKSIPAGYDFMEINTLPIIGYTSANNKFIVQIKSLIDLDGMPIVISQREHRESYQLFFPNSEILVETDQDAALDLVMKHNFFLLVVKIS